VSAEPTRQEPAGGPEIRRIPVAQTRELRQAVLRPHESLEYLAGHETEDAFALGAFEEDRLIGVGFVGRDPHGERGAWRVRGMATVPEARGRGVGGAILAELIEHAVEHGATRIWCNARIPARTLYERGGLRVVSEVFDVPKIGPHLVMEWRPG
jgi:GNAT superfamily N-acetyltransferase